jgi:prepilin-type N-terminal cleavage/methylation domain-containing protein
MKKNRGVTLIELMVSMVIFAIVIVGVTVFNANNTRATVKSERNAKRVALQEKAIEEFKGYLKSASVPGSRFDDIWLNCGVGDTLPAGVFTDSAVDMSVRLEIDSFIPNDSADVSGVGVQLQVRVISTDAHLNISDTVLTFISRHD